MDSLDLNELGDIGNDLQILRDDAEYLVNLIYDLEGGPKDLDKLDNILTELDITLTNLQTSASICEDYFENKDERQIKLDIIKELI